MKLFFTVYGDPVPKGRARVTRLGAYTPKRTVDYERLARASATVGRDKDWPDTWPRHAWYRCEMRIITRTRKIPDADNVGKAILDACKGVLWDNDRTVSAPHPTLYEVCSDYPRVEVTVTVVDPPAGWDKPARGKKKTKR